MNMTTEDIEEYKKNAIEILEKNCQYATAKATEEAFDVLIWLKETVETFNNIPYSYEIPLSEEKFQTYCHC